MSHFRSSRSRFSLLRYTIASILLLSAAAMVTATPVAAQDRPAAESEGPNVSGQLNVRGTVGVP